MRTKRHGILFVAGWGVIFGIMTVTGIQSAVPGNVRSVNVYHPGSLIHNVEFRVPADTSSEWFWILNVNATNDWCHVPGTATPAPGWNMSGSVTFKLASADTPWDAFQPKFYGRIKPCEGEGEGEVVSHRWDVDGTGKFGYFIQPQTTVACVGTEVEFKSYMGVEQDGDHSFVLVESDWEVDGYPQYNTTNAVSISFTASEPDEYTVKGESTSDTELTDSAQVTVVKVEFKTYAEDTPGPGRPHNLNLNTRQNEEEHYDPFKKCVAHIWTSTLFDMATYLDGYDDEDMREIFHEVLQWRVTGGAWQNNHELDLGNRPGLSRVNRYDIEVRLRGVSDSCDRLVVTVVSSEKQEHFNDWYTDELNNMAWLEQLPALYSSIMVNADGNPIPPEPDHCDFWRNPVVYDNFYHPDAFFEMRSTDTPGGHAHQAAYSSANNGVAMLIRTGISAGTADRAAAPSWGGSWNLTAHWEHDVRPFVWAAQLDGNPVEPTWNWRNLQDPILHEGVYLRRYLEVRPPIANDRPELDPENCP